MTLSRGLRFVALILQYFYFEILLLQSLQTNVYWSQINLGVRYQKKTSLILPHQTEKNISSGGI